MLTVSPPQMTTTACATTVPVANSSTPGAGVVVFSLPASRLGPNQVVLVETQVEFDHGTSQFQHVVSIGRQIIRATSPTATTGTPVTEFIVGDAGPGEWAYVFSLMGVDSNIPAGDYYYNVVLSPFSTHASSGETVTVPPGYGDLSILVMNQ